MLKRLGVPLYPIIWIPSSAMTGMAEWLERGLFALSAATGGAVDIHPPLTLHEALKATTTHTHSTELARRLFGYTPIITTNETLRHTADEFAVRYGMD